jgi:aspartate/methionine/tyrosine aminotransferase
MASLEPSATLAMAARAAAMAAAGVDVIDLSVGEPDFPTPEHICRAAEAAIRSGKTKYTPAAGIPALRQAVADDYTRRSGLATKPAQVVVSNGAKHSLHNVFTALLDDGDEVIVPTPYWVSYAELVKLSGGRPVLVETKIEDDFKLRPEALRAAVTPRTRMLLLCSPSNPTGVVYDPAELAALADVAIAADIAVVADEIYDQLVFDGRQSPSFPTLRPGLADRTVVVAGVSKTYSMTGWRIGWTICPEPLAKAIGNLQRQPARGGRRAHRTAGVRRRHAGGLPAAARPRGRPSQGHAGRAAAGHRRRLLRLLRHPAGARAVAVPRRRHEPRVVRGAPGAGARGTRRRQRLRRRGARADVVRRGRGEARGRPRPDREIPGVTA